MHMPAFGFVRKIKTSPALRITNECARARIFQPKPKLPLFLIASEYARAHKLFVVDPHNNFAVRQFTHEQALYRNTGADCNRLKHCQSPN